MAIISISSQTTLLDSAKYFVFALYDATAPTVVIESQQPPKPYGNPLQITFTTNCTLGRVYIVKLWESVDATPTGIVRNSMSVTPNATTTIIRFTEYLEVDITTGLVAGTTAYVDLTWHNWNYTLIRNPNVMVPDNVGLSPYDYTPDTAGGFTLTGTGDKFQPNERFIVIFNPQVVLSTPGTTGPVTAGRIITANETLTSADVGKALIVQSATSEIVLQMPLLATVTDFSFLYFYSNGGTHKNAVFNCQSTDKFYNGGNVGSIILGQQEVLKCYKAFGKYWPDCELNQLVGQLIFTYAIAPVNTLKCAGQLISRATYPRLWAWVSGLESGVVITDSTWVASVNASGVSDKKGFFSSGDGSTTFRLPELRLQMLKGVSSSRLPGSFEDHAGIAHKHEGTTGSLPTSLFGFSNVSRVVGSYSGTNTGPDDLVSLPVQNDGSSFVSGIWAGENKVRNIGTYILIKY